MLNILNEQQISLIKQKVEIGKNRFVVRLNVSGNKTMLDEEVNRNIYCVNDTYQIIWQIQLKNALPKRSSFVGMNLVEENELTAKNFSGFTYKVNLETGEAIEIGWDK